MPIATATAPIGQSEADAQLAALRPPKRPRPLVAVIGINDATETVDYLMPYGILRRSNVADVALLATGRGPVKLFPVLTVQPEQTIKEFDAQHPDGADYVIVPAMKRDDDPHALAWIKAQAGKGATIIGVCAGAKVVARAGLLDGKRATTHWYYRKQLRRGHPRIEYVPDRRFVVDRGLVTTTGITASMPMALTLIEAIDGRATAEIVAHSLGATQWSARHDSSAFRFTASFGLTALRNTLAVWKREELGLELVDGVDEVTLALVADAWSRTYRSSAVTWSRSAEAVETRNGVRVLPDKSVPSWPTERLLPSIAGQKPAPALDEALSAIATRYGARTEELVARQLEYGEPALRSDRAGPSH